MELKVNLTELSLDEIMKKIKVFKADVNLIGLTLIVRKKESVKSTRTIKSKNVEPSHV